MRSELEAFFAGFTAADLYVDLSDLVRSVEADRECRFLPAYRARSITPVTSSPSSIFLLPPSGPRRDFKISSDPRLYVNKRAMDYVAQEVARAEGRADYPVNVAGPHLLSLARGNPRSVNAQKIFDDLAGGFNLRAEIDFKGAARPEGEQHVRVGEQQVVLLPFRSVRQFDGQRL